MTKKKSVFVIKVQDKTLNSMQAKAKAIDYLTDNGLEPETWTTEVNDVSNIKGIKLVI